MLAGLVNLLELILTEVRDGRLPRLLTLLGEGIRF